jgi:hypothetical protein
MEDENRKNEFGKRYDTALNLLHGYISHEHFELPRRGDIRIRAVETPNKLESCELAALHNAGIDLNWLVTGSGEPIRKTRLVLVEGHIRWLIHLAESYRAYHGTDDAAKKADILKYRLDNELSRGRHAQSVCSRWLEQVRSLAVIYDGKEEYESLTIDDLTEGHVQEMFLEFGIDSVAVVRIPRDETPTDETAEVE